MRKFLKDMFTEKDNATWDVAKVLAAGSIMAAIALAVYAVVYNHNEFNVQDYGIGIGALFAGVAVALGLKKESGGEA